MSDNNSGMNNDEYVTLTVDIPYNLKDKLKFCSYKEKKSIKDLVKEALEKYFLDQDEWLQRYWTLNIK